METEIVQPQAGAPVAETAPGGLIPAPTKPAVSATPQTQEVEDENALPAWARKQLKELRAEYAANRKAKTTAEQAATQAAEQAAAEQGKWQELYQKAKPLAERTAAVDAFVTELLEAETATVPEKFRGLVPQGDALTTLRWLREARAAGMFAPPVAPQTDASSGTGRQAPARGALSAEQKQELAARYGVRADLLPDTLGV